MPQKRARYLVCHKYSDSHQQEMIYIFPNCSLLIALKFSDFFYNIYMHSGVLNPEAFRALTWLRCYYY